MAKSKKKSVKRRSPKTYKRSIKRRSPKRSKKSVKRRSPKKSAKRSKRKTPRSATASKCRDWLQDKISINMKEYNKGRWVSRAQAVAVSYSQVKNKHPECKRSLARRK
jgi:hypothetical protein